MNNTNRFRTFTTPWMSTTDGQLRNQSFQSRALSDCLLTFTSKSKVVVTILPFFLSHENVSWHTSGVFLRKVQKVKTIEDSKSPEKIVMWWERARTKATKRCNLLWKNAMILWSEKNDWSLGRQMDFFDFCQKKNPNREI